MNTTTTDSVMNPFSPSAATMTTIPRGPPGVVTYRYQHEKGSEMAYVALADSYEEAQDAATRVLAGLAGVDPRWLVFAITIRYRATNERNEIAIAPGAWGYVTRRLVPYRVIDVRVVPPTPQPASPSKSLAPPYPGTPTKGYAPLYPDAPHKGYAQLYPDTPPPRYPGSPHKHAQLPPEGHGYGYGYGFGWHDQMGGRHGDYGAQLDPSEMADQRSMGWSASSVKVTRAAGGGSLFERLKQNAFGILPITWDDQPEERRRRRGKGRTRRRREREREHEKMQLQAHHEQMHEQASGSGHSYVPSLI